MLRNDSPFQTVARLYQHGHEVVIQPYGKGMLLSWLRPHSDVVSQKNVFEGIPSGKLDKDLIDVASMVINKAHQV